MPAAPLPTPSSFFLAADVGMLSLLLCVVSVALPRFIRAGTLGLFGSQRLPSLPTSRPLCASPRASPGASRAGILAPVVRAESRGTGKLQVSAPSV